MTYTEARTSKLVRRLAVLQASITMLSLLTLSFPAAAFATSPQNNPPRTSIQPEGNDHKTEVCHKDDDGSHVIEVDDNAVQAHLDHGDSLDTEHCGDTASKSCTFVSDATTLVNDAPAVPTFVHSAWNHSLESSTTPATWIWNAFHVTTPLLGETLTFTKKFNAVGTPTSVLLTMAADNSYTVLVNGTAASCDGSGLDNFTTLDTCDITSLVTPNAINTLTFTVTNAPWPTTDPEANPGGLIYNVAMQGASCGEVPPPGPQTGHVKIIKHVINDNGGSLAASAFQIHVKNGEADVSGSPADGSETGTDYTLAAGDYQVSEDANASYTTTYSQTCSEGHLHLTAGGDTTCTVINTYVPPVNSCVAPSAAGGPAHITLGASYVPTEKSVQDVLIAAGYSTNADTAQVNTQTWGGSGNTVDFSVRALSKNANDSHVFGYILNDGSFVGVFRDGPISTTTYASLPLKTTSADGDTAFSLPGVNNVAFAIWDENSGKLYSTKKTSNTDGLDHAVVYNPLSNEYVIGFEDVTGGGDHDMNDLIVALKVNGCHDANTTATVVATKIVCDNESDLPNLAGSSHTTGATTADDFLKTHPACHLEPNWQFEWGNQNAGDTADNFTGPAGNGYTTSSFTNASGTVSMTVPLQNLSSIHIREVLQAGYIGFTHGAHPDNSDTVSAELACSADGLNYDNWDWINNPVAGETYYCVAYNAKAKSDVTLCKFDDQEHTLSGWNLFLKGAHVEDVVVPTNTSAGINSANPLVAGASYLALASGTWTNQGAANPVDAEYSTTDSWTTHMNGYTGYGAGILETEINQTDGNWGPYNSAHSYAQSFTATTSTSANFRIFDGDTGTHIQNEGWFGDNSGTLSVGLFKGYAGITSENGCVTFKNVPYGTYTVGETAQDGWSTVSGATEVTVDAPTKTFNVVNHHNQCVLTSSTTTYEGGDASVLSSYIHSAWTAVINSASWIWGENHALTDPAAVGSTETFTKTFTLDQLPLSAKLEIAADNGYSITVNGNAVGSDATEFNYTSAGQDLITIPAADLVVGANTVVITVNNFAQANGTWATNPAGLLYKLTIEGANCEETTPPPTSVKVHIFKYLWNGDGGYNQVEDDFEGPQFPMVVSYSATNIGSGSDVPYVLGNQHGGAAYKWSADSAPMDAPANFVTTEVTGGDSVVVANADACSPGKYYLVGYQNGSSLSAAQTAPITASPTSYVGITTDQYEIVLNRACPAGDTGGGETTHTDETIVVKAADLATSVVDAAANTAKWFFYNDNNDTVNDALGSFVTGPATAPLSTGSAQIALDATNNRTNLSTFGFGGVKLADIKTLAYSAYSVSGVAGPNESPYLVMNVDFNNSNTWQKRLVYVPANNGPVPQNTWNTNDTINGGAGMWVYSGATWPSSAIPGTTARSWSAILAAYPNARILPSDPHLGVRVGEPGPTGYTGNIDQFVIGVQTGSNIDTKTFDFEPTAAVVDGGGGGIPQIFTYSNNDGGSGGGTTRKGSVLGESTSTPVTCGPLLKEYLKLNWKNDPDQVKKLQNFLNGNLHLNLPITGFFGPLTHAAVKNYQKGSWEDVLKPWFGHPGSGISSQNTPTGFVYQTTRWHINNDYCPGSEDFPSNLD